MARGLLIAGAVLSAAAVSLGNGANVAEAGTRVAIGFGFPLFLPLPPLPPLPPPPLPPLFAPPTYYSPPPAYYAPPAATYDTPAYEQPPPTYYAPPAPAYYAPPPPAYYCRPRHDWRWTNYGWRRAYVGCW